MAANEANAGNVTCAVCTIRNKRCSALCEFAPYFPPETLNEFGFADELYGYLKIMKMIRNAPDVEKQKLATSILRESVMWEGDLLRGAFGRIRSLMWELKLRQAYLFHIKDLIKTAKEMTQLRLN